jgi:hypothetical protein
MFEAAMPDCTTVVHGSVVMQHQDSPIFASFTTFVRIWKTGGETVLVVHDQVGGGRAITVRFDVEVSEEVERSGSPGTWGSGAVGSFSRRAIMASILNAG